MISVPVSGLGQPYEGDLFRESERTNAGLYAAKTKAVFRRYGLGVESSARFFEIFFEEYFSLLPNNIFLREFQEVRPLMNCFEYGTTVNPFVEVIRNDYRFNVSLEERFKHLLPSVDLEEYGNVEVIVRKIKGTN